MEKNELIEELKKENFPTTIINAFKEIKREDFVPEELKQYAYENEPLPLGFGATISQPYTIAFMLNLMELDELNKNPKYESRILEIGSGSGYVLALINKILKNSEIYGVEIIKELAESSKQILKNIKNIKIICRNGANGLKEKSPFDRILISAAAEKIPEHLFPQLKENGILVCPVLNSIFQIKKLNNEIQKKEFSGFIFVPLKTSKKFYGDI